MEKKDEDGEEDGDDYESFEGPQKGFSIPQSRSEFSLNPVIPTVSID